MKINRFAFQNNHLEIEDDVDFSLAQLDQNHIRKINNTHVKVKGTEYDEIICLELDITTDVIGVCSYTLEDVPLHLHFKDSLEFSNDIDDDDEIIYVDKPIFDIDEYILQLLKKVQNSRKAEVIIASFLKTNICKKKAKRKMIVGQN